MNGPYLIVDISTFVDAGTMGVYILTRNGRTAHYVGRSDTDLRREIRESATLGPYTHFWYAYESSPMQAYKSECCLWHKYDPPDNDIHPAVPAGTNWRCPVEGCQWS